MCWGVGGGGGGCEDDLNSCVHSTPSEGNLQQYCDQIHVAVLVHSSSFPSPFVSVCKCNDHRLMLQHGSAHKLCLSRVLPHPHPSLSPPLS